MIFCLLIIRKGDLIAQNRANHYNFLKLFMNRSDLFSVLLLLVVGTLAQNVTYGNLTFEPPPTIIPNNRYTITNSSQDGKLIWSPKLEVLNLDAWTGPGSVPMTNATLTVYNRSATMSKSQYTLPLPGNWEHIESSIQDLSCSLLIQTNSRNMSILSWDRVTSTLAVAGILPLVMFTQDAAVLNSSIPVAKGLIAQAMTVGASCEKMTYVNGNLTAAYRADLQAQTVHIIALPTWQLQAVSYDLNYAVASDQIWAYDRTTFQYKSVYTFPTVVPGTKFQIRTVGGRVLIWTRYSTSSYYNITNQYMISSLVQVYMFHQGSTFALIGSSDLFSHFEALPTPDSQFTVFYSPQLSKIGFGYYQQLNNRTVVYARHTDFNRNTWTPIAWSNPQRYLQTVQNIDPLRQLDFNDFYFVVRNSTRATDPTNQLTTPYELVYQAVGDNFTMINDRNLALDNNTVPGTNITRELTTFVKTFIEPSITTKCLVLNVYSLDNTTYQIVQFDYGNIRSNRKVIRTPDPPYIMFTEPFPIYDKASSLHIYQWAYFIENSMANSSTLKVFTLDNSTTSHYRVNDYPLTGTVWGLIYQNPGCKVTRSFDSQDIINLNVEFPNGTYESIANLRTVINGSVTNSSLWEMSLDCSRFRVDNRFYYRIPQTNNYAEFTVPSNFTLDKVDYGVNYATSTDGDLWQFNVNSGALEKVYTPPKPFPTGATLLSAGNRVGLGYTTANSAWFLGLQKDSTGQFQKCINYTNDRFTEQPILEASPLLTKVLMIGRARDRITNLSTVVTDFYFIQCPKFLNISLPNTNMQNPSKLRVSLGQDALHVLQIHNSSSVPVKDIVYYLDHDSVAIMAFQNPITIPADTQWIRSQVYLSDSGNNYLLSEYVWTNPSNGSHTQRMVNVTQINGEQAIFNSKHGDSFTAVIVNGQIKMNSPGCSDSQCTGCVQGFAHDADSSSCVKCAPGCTGCTVDDPTACSGCMEGSFLNSSNSCQPCDYECQTCSINATDCSSCPPGQFYFSGQCILCPKNCFECTDNSTCTECIEGFTVTASNLCRGCSIKCAQCNPYNITECTACSDGLYLDTNSQCQRCTDTRCTTCASASSCTTCVDGYEPSKTNAAQCIVTCQLPCVTCLDNNPRYCLSCLADSAPSNGVCQVNYPCNADQTCDQSSCGSGLNYYYTPTNTGGKCSQCPIQDNCIQCDELDQYTCAICQNGLYVNKDGNCTACNSNCTSCQSQKICTGCSPGFYLKKNQARGKCRPCSSPCLTCQKKHTHCMSCISGFTLEGWKCRNNTGTQFTFVFSVAPDVILGDIDQLACKIVEVLKGLNITNSTDCDQAQVTFTDIAAGSTSVSGTSSSGNAANLATASNSLGYTVVSSSVTTYGTQQASEQSSNTGLIVGLVVGIIALVVVVVVIVYCIKKRQTKAISSVEEDNVMIEATPEKNKLPQDSGYQTGKQPISHEAMVEKFE